MKKLFTLLTMLILCIGSSWAESYYFATAPTQVTSITSGNYYVIDGLNQQSGGTAGHFLFDNGTKVTSNNPQALPTDWTAGKFIWKIVGNSTDGYTLQNLQTRKYMSLGSSNGSQISSSSTSQTNGIYFGTDNYATIRNSNGQAIDIGALGDSPTTWSGTTTPSGSRRLVIYEVNVVEIADDACYTITFNAKTSGNTWGLRSGTTETSPNKGGAGDVYVAHSYTNTSGNKRWIFVNNDNGTYLAYHGQANASFNMSHAINEWSIASLTAGSGKVNADANCASKVCITNDKRYTNNASNGCYIVNESSGAYDNSSGPYYNGSYTSALTFTATGDGVSSAAALAIAKFDALQTLKSYKAGSVHIPALFPTEAVTNDLEASVISGVNAATTTDEIATALDDLYKIAEGRKFYAVQSTATDKYMNIGTSQITATSTQLNNDAVMEVEYAGNGKFYLKGVKSGYYAGDPNSGQANPGTHSTKETAQALYIGNLGSTDNQVYFAKTTVGLVEAIHYNANYSGYVVGWSYSSGGSQWNITACDDREVTYNVVIEASGDVKATATETGVIGGTLAVPSSATRDYCTYTYYSDEACTSALTTVPASGTVYALSETNAPFTVSTDYANAVWYNMRLHNTYYPLYKSDNTPNVTLPTAPGTEANTEWAFIGNPYDGFQIINKGAGDGLVLGSATDDAGTTGSESYATMATSGTQTYEKWFPKTSTHYPNGFYLYNSNNHALNKRSEDNLAYWTGGADSGSTFTVTSVTANATELTAIVDKLDACTYGTAFGEYSLSGDYTGYESYMKTVIIPGLRSSYTYEHLLNARAIDAAKILNLPKAGSFIRVKGATTSKYVLYGDKVNSRYPMGDDNTTSIFYFDGTHMLSYSSGIYWGVTGGNGTTNWNWTSVGDTGSTIAFDESNTLGKYYVKLTSVEQAKPYVALYDNGNREGGGCCDRGGFANKASVSGNNYNWTLEKVTELPVTLKASALGYATFCCPVPVKIPSGVEAFVSKIEDNTIKLFRIENFKDAEENVVIPANTAVMLHNKNFNEIDETFSFEIAEYSGEGITDNGFYGTIPAESMVAGKTYYSLRTWKVNDVPTKVGFATKTSGSLAGFKAWICEEGQSARNFTIVFDSDSDPTGIVEALGLEDANVEIYDLNGRKLSSYKRGINIVNGKKVMVK